MGNGPDAPFGNTSAAALPCEWSHPWAGDGYFIQRTGFARYAGQKKAPLLRAAPDGSDTGLAGRFPRNFLNR